MEITKKREDIDDTRFKITYFNKNNVDHGGHKN